MVWSQIQSCSQPQTITSGQDSPLGSGFSSHVSYKQLKELNWTLINGAVCATLGLFLEVKIGPSDYTEIS